MKLGKVRPTATIVAQFAAGVEVEAIQHEGKIFLPAIAIGDFVTEPTPERKSEPVPEVTKVKAGAGAAPSAEAPAKSHKAYTKDEMMEMSSKDLEKILRKEFGVDPDQYEGKNTNKKLRDLILEAQKGGSAPAGEEESKAKEKEESTEDNEAVTKVAEILSNYDDGKVSRKKAIAAIAEACDTDDTDSVSDLLDEFDDDSEAEPTEFAEKLIASLSGEGGEGDGDEDGDGELVEISDLEVGDKVSVWWNDDNQAWFTGVVDSIKRGKVNVKYDDGTEGILEPDLHTSIKRL